MQQSEERSAAATSAAPDAAPAATRGPASRKRRAGLEQPLTFARGSVAHEEHPKRNEDYVVADASRGLAAVFDGVGGIIGGEIASRVAARTIQRAWKKLVQGQQQERRSGARSHKQTALLDCTRLDLPAELRCLIEETHRAVRSEGTRRAKEIYGRQIDGATPKTTVALAALCRTPRTRGYTLVYAWVGDSRIYLLRAGQPLLRLTSDDGLLTELVNSRLLPEKDALRIDQASQPWHLTKIERFYFEKRNGITQALGDRDAPDIHLGQTTIKPGDRLLLCTDGIHDNLTDRELEELVRRGARTTVARQIIRAAVERSRHDSDEAMRAKPDDMSAVVITCQR